MDVVAEHVIPESEVAAFGAGSDWISRLAALSLQQRRAWPMLTAGHAGLATAQVRHFQFDGFEVRTQFNPGRMASAAARVDSKSVQQRRCFLCPAHLPAGQMGLRYGDYLILCNPFPILDEHFTIPHTAHRPQAIAETFGDYVNLVRDLGTRYSVLYNGPKAGASAPDHLHFQAGTRGWMPIDGEYVRVRERLGMVIAERPGVRVRAVTDYLRPIMALEGRDDGAIRSAFAAVYGCLHGLCPGESEPMMNLIAWCDADEWTILIFPRGRHRPSCFFAEGESQIMVSPGAVDVGGVIITPVAESFERLNRDTIQTIFSEVSLPADQFASLQERLRKAL